MYKINRDSQAIPVVKNPPPNAGDAGNMGLTPASGRTWPEKEMATHSSIPGKFHGQRSLVGYSVWDCEESNMTA